MKYSRFPVALENLWNFVILNVLYLKYCKSFATFSFSGVLSPRKINVELKLEYSSLRYPWLLDEPREHLTCHCLDRKFAVTSLSLFCIWSTMNELVPHSE